MQVVEEEELVGVEYVPGGHPLQTGAPGPPPASEAGVDGLIRTTLSLCACEGGTTHVIVKNDWSAPMPEFPGFHGLHCESASASATNGHASMEQSDMQFASTHDSAALVHEGKIMKREDSGWGTQAPAMKSRVILGATKLAQNSALANTLRLIRVTSVLANLPAPQVLHAAAEVAPEDDNAVPAGQGVHAPAAVAPVTVE